ISMLTSLTDLGLSGNQLSSLPESISMLTSLTDINLSYNQLSSLPESISMLTSLTYLMLSNNQLSSLPESISKLTSLTNLDLTQNQLSSLPESISKLTSLINLDLLSNKFKVGDEVFELPIEEQINEILKWQKAQKAGTLQPINEAKVIFIGESNYGKTHLIELLREGEIKRNIKTTHGIERSQLKIPYKNKDIRLNIWDLGGQEFMRSTHQFFFSERTLYILVTIARRERNELNHWLKLVNQLGNKAPVLVVINKIDLDPHDLDRKSLERDYPNIIGFVRTCIKDCKDTKSVDSINLLKKKITTIVSDKNIMPGVFEQRPPDWFTVKEELEKLEAKGTDFITFQEYEDLEFIKDLPADERKSNLKLLSMLGAVVS
ncbi:MAG: GTP-binding protein, partial [Bacteroidales bacterium]|nr:GTP-binding protein [Bacteroidales bacterium]